MQQAASPVATGPAPTQSVSDLVYRRPRPLNYALDGAASLRNVVDFRFAGGINSILLASREFAAAAHCYPIVFGSGEAPAPLAVLGLRAGENLFVAADGQWLAGHHLPLFIRRYPFGLMQHPDGEQLVLCIDEAAEALVKSDERPLFQNGEPTQLVRDALALCGELHGQHQATVEFVRVLHQQGLLVRNELRFVGAGGEQLTLNGFDVVDEAKFTALPDEVFLDWRRRGWLNLIYCHLLSMANWRKLADLASQPRR